VPGSLLLFSPSSRIRSPPARGLGRQFVAGPPFSLFLSPGPLPPSWPQRETSPGLFFFFGFGRACLPFSARHAEKKKGTETILLFSARAEGRAFENPSFFARSTKGMNGCPSPFFLLFFVRQFPSSLYLCRMREEEVR